MACNSNYNINIIRPFVSLPLVKKIDRKIYYIRIEKQIHILPSREIWEHWFLDMLAITPLMYTHCDYCKTLYT